MKDPQILRLPECLNGSRIKYFSMLAMSDRVMKVSGLVTLMNNHLGDE